jgi:hypothetical protein
MKEEKREERTQWKGKEEAKGSTRCNEKEEDHYHTPVAGSRWGKPPSGLAQGDAMGGYSNAAIPSRADNIQTNSPRQHKNVSGVRKTRMESATDPSSYGALCLNDLHRADDKFFSKQQDKAEKEGEEWSHVGTSGGSSTTPVAGSSWGDPPSGLAQGVPGGSPTSPTTKDRADQIQILKLERPKQLRGDGQSYLRCTPLAAKFRLGGPRETERPGLVDVCSNIGLIDKELFLERYPNTTVHESSRKVNGVGSVHTAGFAVIPVWLECRREGSRTSILAEFDVEIHLVPDFAPGFLLGLDAIKDYEMDILTGTMTGRLNNLEFPLFTHASPRFSNVRIFTAQKFTIPGRCTMPIRIKGALQEGVDYTFEPYMLASQSIPCYGGVWFAAVSLRYRYGTKKEIGREVFACDGNVIFF